jgi:hypothetical protein
MATESPPPVALLFIVGILMSLWFGGRFNIRVMSDLARFERRRLRDQAPDPVIDFIAGMELRDTLVRDAIGTVLGLSASLISLSFL